MIESFNGSYRFLSNFWPSKIMYGGLLFDTAEHAFQAAKTNDPATKATFSHLQKPSEAKKLGRKVKLRSDWEAVKIQVMEEILRLKFAPGSSLAEKLIATGDQPIVEGNYWGDKFWGVCRGEGQNHLGKLLMKIREELKAKN